MNRKKIKIFLADRQSIFFEVIKEDAQKQNIEITGEANGINDLLTRLETNPSDLLLTDHYLYGGDASDFLPIIKEKFPKLKILMFTMYCSKEGLLKYIGYIDGFICKTASKEEIFSTIIGVASGKSIYTISDFPQLTKKLTE